jgi:hypothetical protein
VGINSVIFCGNVYYGLRGCGKGMIGKEKFVLGDVLKWIETWLG